MTTAPESADEHDVEIELVAAWIEQLDPTGKRWAAVVRHTYDMIYNGAETGRYRWDQLAKTEKTHFGTIFEINAQREFRFQDGESLDFRILDVDVDAKWSQNDGAWMLPPEVVGKLALVATGSDPKSEFSIGLLRVRPEFLTQNSDGNRDKKSWLSPFGKTKVKWLFRHERMPESVLLHLDRNTVDEIFSSPHGTKRVDQLFRAAEGLLVHRTAVRTVAMQLDDQKRVRYNGGARSSLQPEGFLVLSGTYHSGLAEQLGLPIPSPLQYISVKVVPSNDPEGAVIAGRYWRRASNGDVISEPAPLLPERGSSSRSRRFGAADKPFD